MSGRQRPRTVLGRQRRRATLVAVLVALAMLAVVVLPLVAVAVPPVVAAPADPGTPPVTRAPVPPEVPAVLGVEPSAVRTVWLWSTGYLQGEPGAEPVVPADQWIAPAADGTGGTRTAWRDPEGEIALAMTDDDAVLAAALPTVPAEDLLVTDRGEWLVVSDGTVRSLIDDHGASLPEPVPLAEHQVGRAAEYAADLARGPTDEGGGEAGGPPGPDGASEEASDGRAWALAVAGVAALGALLAFVVVLRARRRDAG